TPSQLTTPGIGRGLVQVFDIDSAQPITDIELFSDTPRALASSPDGKRVYAAAFLSGNRTTAVTEFVVTTNGGLPPPPIGTGPGAPDTGLIVKFNPINGRWEELREPPDSTPPRDWTSSVPFSLPDYDVFAIDALAAVPKVERKISGVGTVLFNMA